jgi:hypothetical protein
MAVPWEVRQVALRRTVEGATLRVMAAHPAAADMEHRRTAVGLPGSRAMPHLTGLTMVALVCMVTTQAAKNLWTVAARMRYRPGSSLLRRLTAHFSGLEERPREWESAPRRQEATALQICTRGRMAELPWKGCLNETVSYGRSGISMTLPRKNGGHEFRGSTPRTFRVKFRRS